MNLLLDMFIDQLYLRQGKFVQNLENFNPAQIIQPIINML